MREFTRVRILDDQVFEEYKKYYPLTPQSVFKEKYPHTFTLCQFFDMSVNFIKVSIFTGCESDDYYGVKVLLRSLIEHFIRFQYIFIKWSVNQTDSIAKDYIESNIASEMLDTIRASINSHKLNDPSFTIENWNSLLKKYPQFQNKTKKEIEKEALKYTFKNVIGYLNFELKRGNSNVTESLSKLLVEYSQLSSFVHGGMSSHQEMMQLIKESDRAKEYKRIFGLSFQLSTSIKLFTLLMYFQTDDKTYSHYYHNIDNLLRKLTAE